ncbi:MAG: hypothetical protein ACOC2C_01195, partial [Cyclonatronaceae bacterium]
MMMRLLLPRAVPGRKASRSSGAFLFFLLLMASALLPAAPALAQAEGGQFLHVVWQDDDGRRALPDSLRRIPLSQNVDAALRRDSIGPAAALEQNKISIAAHRRFIRQQLAADGYLSAEIEALRLETAEDAITLHIRSRRGPVYSLRFWQRRLETDPDSAAPSEAELQEFAALQSDVQGRYREARIEREIRQYLDFWEQRGRLFVRVEMDSLKLYDEAREAGLFSTIRPGPQVRLSRQLFPGISRNDPAFLARITGLEEDGLLTPEKLRSARSSLENTGLFRQVSEPALLRSDGEFHLVYELEERRTNAFDLLLGYVPQNDGTGNTLIGNGELLLRNVFVPGSRLDIRFDRLQQFVTRLDMAYEAAYIGSTPFGGSARFRL